MLIASLSRPSDERVAALPGFLHHRAIASGFRPGSRRYDVEMCRAELDWAAADWRRTHPGHDARYDGDVPRLPHEEHAAFVVNMAGKVAAWRFAIGNANQITDREWIVEQRKVLRKAMWLLWTYRQEWKAQRAKIDAALARSEARAWDKHLRLARVR